MRNKTATNTCLFKTEFSHINVKRLIYIILLKPCFGNSSLNVQTLDLFFNYICLKHKNIHIPFKLI